MSVTRNRAHSCLFFPLVPDKHRLVAKEEKIPDERGKRDTKSVCISCNFK